MKKRIYNFDYLGTPYINKQGHRVAEGIAISQACLQIMKDKKYYTPEISEFHVGFEYEHYIRNYGGDWAVQVGAEEKWHKSTWKPSFELRGMNLSDIRVKHLDQSDIESEGWEDLNISSITSVTHYTKKNVSNFYILTHYEGGKVDISSRLGGEAPDQFLFQGVIKNKSELKRLKQLGI